MHLVNIAKSHSHKKITFFLLMPLLTIALITLLSIYLPQIASVSTNVGGRELPIYCVDTKKPQISLSFDAAWGNEDTSIILDILAKYNVKATFFMTGGWVETYPDEVKKILTSGHDLGNHSENHKYMSKLTSEQRTEELMKVHNKVKELTGVDMNLFRPPYGDYSDGVIKDATANGYHSIQWSIDSLDWKDYGADSIIKTVTEHKNLENGAIILMHNGSKFTKDALETIIITLLDKGYEFVPISQLIYLDKFHMDHAGKQIADS